MVALLPAGSPSNIIQIFFDNFCKIFIWYSDSAVPDTPITFLTLFWNNVNTSILPSVKIIRSSDFMYFFVIFNPYNVCDLLNIHVSEVFKYFEYDLSVISLPMKPLILPYSSETGNIILDLN